MDEGGGLPQWWADGAGFWVADTGGQWGCFFVGCDLCFLS